MCVSYSAVHTIEGAIKESLGFEATLFVSRHRGETIQDFLIEMDMKPYMQLVEISIFSLNNVTVRHTKIMNNHFRHLKILTLKEGLSQSSFSVLKIDRIFPIFF